MRTSQVFVSHTSDMDQFPVGRSFVQAALDAVSRARLAPVDMRYFAARDGKPADYCRQRVRECEIYVAVIGFRYGSMVPGQAVSYTELEFDEASVAGLPRLVFLLEKPAGLPARLTDADRGAVERFRQRLRSAGLVVRAFSSAAALELEVFHALMEVTAGRTGASSDAGPYTHFLPSGIPVAAPASTGTWIVEANPHLWLRSGPGVDYPTVDRLYYGQRAYGNCDGVESGGTTWYLLRRNGDGLAWGNSKYLQPQREP